MPRLAKTLTLHVTEDVIDRARPGCSRCPIALAIQARGFDAAVGDRSATVSLAAGVFEFAEYRLPRIGRSFVERFDLGLALRPVSFRITRR